MATGKKSVPEIVTELITPTIESLGCSIWDVEFVKEGARRILRVTIDREGGVDIDHCELVHRAIDPLLDDADPISESYYLEVSSPGIERELRTPEHFALSVGQTVDCRFFSLFEGVKMMTGTLDEYDKAKGILTLSGNAIPLEKIAKVNIHFDFDD